jgi:hypothetical protein
MDLILVPSDGNEEEQAAAIEETLKSKSVNGPHKHIGNKISPTRTKLSKREKKDGNWGSVQGRH